MIKKLKAAPEEILRNKLVVDVLSVKMYPKNMLMRELPESPDFFGQFWTRTATSVNLGELFENAVAS